MSLGGLVAVPGTRLGHIENFISGSGTYVRDDYIYSSLVGEVIVDETNGQKTLNVKRSSEPTIVPTVGSIVTG
jgi:exosome complex component CSL4